MAKKKTIRQRNEDKIKELLKKRVSGKNGFLKSYMKQFISEELLRASNNNNKLISSKETLQTRYNKYKKYYDLLFESGLEGHAYHAESIVKKAEKDNKKKIQYFVNENGKEKKVTPAELGYKMNLLATNLSAKHDVALTKFKPKYYLTGKGRYKIVITIPKLSDADFDEMDAEEITEWFEDNGIVIIISDPNDVKGKEAKKDFEKSKKRRQHKIKESKEKYFKKWKKGKKK